MPEMSWLSPKRRRTTGNLKTIPNGQINNARAGGEPATPEAPSRVRTPTSERAPSIPRPLSQPVESSALPGSDGNLFYAYARRGDDLKSRYLLTFASAGIASEWWLLLQAHFPEATRPGPQLFSFRDADLLSKTWKHPAFAHLKSKWMYISFGDTKESGIGGAAQGIIPVQDVQGNMLGGSSPASPELVGQVGQVRREAKGVRNELTKLEEYFEKTMGAVERNTDRVAALVSKQQAAGGEGVQKQENGGYFNTSELSGYLVRINDLLTHNSEHVEGMAKRQSDNDQKLQAALQDLSSRQKKDYLDMSQLSSHLDRIQSLMEQGIRERKDSAKEIAEQQSRASTQIDWTPLIDRLEKVQDAVEQNSALVKALLDEGAAAESKPGTPFWAGKQSPPTQPQPTDFSPLTEHLQKIHTAIEQQSQHMQELVGFASGDGQEGATLAPSGPGDTAEKSLAPLGEHLEQIYNAIEEGNRYAKDVASRPEPKQLDLSPVADHLEALRRTAADNNCNIKALLDAQESVRTATESNGRPDMSHVGEKLDEVAELLKQLNQSQIALQENVEPGKHLNLAPLAEKLDVVAEHLGALRTSSEESTDNFKHLIDAHKGLRAAVDGNEKPDFAPLGEKFDGLNEHLESLREWTEYNAEQFKEFVDSSRAERAAAKFSGAIDFSPLTEHLRGMQLATEQNSAHVKALLELHEQGSQSNNNDIDFTPLTDRLNRIYSAIEKQADRRDQSPGTGDSKFLMSALTSHLSKIQAVTEHNAQHVKALREKHSATQDKMHIAVSQTSEQVHALSAHQARNDERIDATNSQVRELMAGQREMVDAMRELAKSITAQNKGACDHVVIPPPRKVGRKVVGFVYDAKDGPA